MSYQSAHIPEAKSELVVRSDHSVQSNPHTVSEVRRILLLHLVENCPQGCASEPAPEALPVVSAPSDARTRVAASAPVRQHRAATLSRALSPDHDGVKP